MARNLSEKFSGTQLDMDVENPEDFHILVEFPDSDARYQPGQPVTRSGDVVQRTIQQIEERSQAAVAAAMSTIREMAILTDHMRQTIPGGAQPRMIKVKFGIKLDAEAGAIIAKSSAGASFEVELEWARRADDILRILQTATNVNEVLTAEPDS
jgi:hypothetical protein